MDTVPNRMSAITVGDRVSWVDYTRLVPVTRTGVITRISRDWGLADVNENGTNHVVFIGELTRLAPSTLRDAVNDYDEAKRVGDYGGTEA